MNSFVEGRSEKHFLVPPTKGLQVTVAWGHRWRAPKRENSALAESSTGDCKLLYRLYPYQITQFPGGISGTPMGLDPDFRSQRTRTLGLTRDPPESQFQNKGSNWLSTEGKLRPQSLKWTGFLVGESPDHAFWDYLPLTLNTHVQKYTS